MEGLNIFRICWMIYILQGLPLNVISATSNGERIVLVSTTSSIYLSRGPDFDFNQLPISVGRPGGLDFDVEIGMLFWTDTSAYAIKRAEINGTSWTSVISTGSNPAAIAIDGNENLIFWVDSRISTRTIQRATYDGGERTQIIAAPAASRYSSRPTSIDAITLDRITRTLYWGQGNSLRSSSYEGLNQRTIFSSSSVIPDLAFNIDGSRVFWCERNSVKTIEMIRSGGGATTLQSLSFSTCSGVAWFEGDLYWTYGRSLSVKDGETDVVRVIPFSTSSSSTTGIFVGRRTVQDPSDGKCDFDRFRCRWNFKNSMSNDLDWARSSAELTANSTGPTVDHTTQSRTGHYMLLNTSSPAHSPGNLASLISPQVNVSGSAPQCFRFWYYMHDVTNGSLTVFFQQSETKLTTLWSVYGSQPDEWVGAEIEVRASGVGYVLIKAVVGDPRLNIIGIDDVHFGECQQDSRLVCEDSSMTLYLDKARLGISSQDRVSFKNSLCRGTEYDADTVAITAPYNGCGTTVSESDDVILFSNQVNVMVHSNIRSSGISIRVNCSMSRTYHVAMTYLAHSWISYIREDGYGNFSVRISQFTNVKFEDAYPGDTFPQQVEIDDRIYMATEMVTIKDVVDTIQNARCWATPSRDPSDPVSRDIINDGCPTGDGTKVYTLMTHGLQAFSFKAFSFSRDENLIYVHCDLIICHDSEQSACTSNCSHSRPVREARDSRDSGFGPYTVSQGPFMYKMAATSQKDGASVIVILLSALVCTTVLLVATIFMGVFIYARNRMGMRCN